MAHILGSHLIPGTLLSIFQHVNTNPVNATNVTSLDVQNLKSGLSCQKISDIDDCTRIADSLLSPNSARRDCNAVSSFVQIQRRTRGIVAPVVQL